MFFNQDILWKPKVGISFLCVIDGLRKAGDAPGHKIVVAVCVCVFVVVCLLLLLLLLLLLCCCCCCCCCCWWWFLLKLLAISLPKKGCPIFYKKGQPFFSPWSPKIEPKLCNLECFRLLPRTKQRYLRRFLTLGAPKSSQNIGIYNVFATPKKTHVAKTPLFATLWQDHMSEMLYFTVFFNHLLKKHWYLQCF